MLHQVFLSFTQPKRKISHIVDSPWQSGELPVAALYWRVTATSASGLDGYPSPAVPFQIVTEIADQDPPAVAVRFATIPAGAASGWVIGASAIGSFLGSVIGGFLADEVGFNAINWMAGIAAGLAVLLIFMLKTFRDLTEFVVFAALIFYALTVAAVYVLRRRRPDMSIIVSTAYMEEAERFDTLVAMDAGRVLASGSADVLKRQTGESDMEAVFVSLLPAERRRGHRRLTVPPRGSMEDGPPAIEAEGLTRRFGDFTAVDGVTLEIHKGEIFGFLGSNGSGKTTTMRMLTGLLPLSDGRARVFGTPVGHDDAALRHRLGFMSQSFSLYGELSVRQNLDLHARLFQLTGEHRRERMALLTERFGLDRYLEQRAEQLPLGVRQRLSLAVAMIHEPELLILDEPTSGVDPVARDGFWALLAELARE